MCSRLRVLVKYIFISQNFYKKRRTISGQQERERQIKFFKMKKLIAAFAAFAIIFCAATPVAAQTKIKLSPAPDSLLPAGHEQWIGHGVFRLAMAIAKQVSGATTLVVTDPVLGQITVTTGGQPVTLATADTSVTIVGVEINRNCTPEGWPCFAFLSAAGEILWWAAEDGFHQDLPGYWQGVFEKQRKNDKWSFFTRDVVKGKNRNIPITITGLQK